jgi:hypothetical protein
VTDPTDQTKHELETFLEQDLAELASEYDRIRARSTEDPGTAGDEGEEVWAQLLRDWLPDQYEIRTKGRILGADATAGPQVDLLVLRPGYPKRLLSKKLYLAGGVAAVFECKNTLKASHISDAFDRSARINALSSNRSGTPFLEIVPAIPFGLLAHSHSWKAAGSNPKGTIDAALGDGLAAISHPSDPPVLLCVADLGCWDIHRQVYDGPGLMPPEVWKARQERTGLPDEGALWVAYMRFVEDASIGQAPFNALAVAIAYIIGRLAHDDVAIRALSQYLHAAGLSGSGASVAARRFPLNTYSSEVLGGLPRRLTNGVSGSEWSIGYPF